MAVKRLTDEAARDRRLLAKSDDRVIEALEAGLRERNPDPELTALLDDRDAARGRLKNRKKKPPAE